MIQQYEIELAKQTLEIAQRKGASKCRVALSKSVSDIISTLDGQIDKVSHCLDRGLSLTLFVDGRFGTFSTNQLSEDSLEDFVEKAVAMTRILAEDPLRDLPDAARCCKANAHRRTARFSERSALRSIRSARAWCQTKAPAPLIINTAYR